jgi:23S rRNA pseudouridine1911/1915/1917 synthase
MSTDQDKAGNNAQVVPYRVEIPASAAGQRVDKALAALFSDHSRVRIQQWIKDGLVLLDEEVPRQKDKVAGGEQVDVNIPQFTAGEWQAEEIPLDVIYEDEAVLVIDKPAGLVVHPGAGNDSGTLLNGLLHYDDKLREIPRAGIVHRLDKGTTGLMVVARTEAARLSLVGQLADHTVKRVYLALVCGKVIAGGTVDEPIGRDRRDRRRMTVTGGGKVAVTHYRIEERFAGHTLLRVSLETGRTHQIRVHMRHIGYPLVGDPVYGGRLALPPDCSDALADALRQMRRQVLHAVRLEFSHPLTGEQCILHAEPPVDMQQLLRQLRGNDGS